MPTSKRPRKPYRGAHQTRRVYGSFRLLERPAQEAMAVMRELFDDVALAVEIKLPRGTCTDSDLSLMRDMIHWGITATACRTWCTEESRVDAYKATHDGAKYLSQLQHRGRQRGYRFIATGQELEAIRTAFDFVGSYLQQSLTECPIQTLKEYQFTKEMIKTRGAGKPDVWRAEDIRRAVKNYKVK